MFEDIITLPLEIQFPFATGYTAYLLAFSGIRSAHKAVDTIFIILIFSSIATLFFAALEGYGPVFAGASSFVGTCISSVFWRRVLRFRVRYFMRNLDISWANDDPSALATLCDDTQHEVTQVAVRLNNGSWLRCDDTSAFNDAPYAPFLVSPSGDLALYLTHEDTPDGNSRESLTTVDELYGARLTYVPASNISEINLRHRKRGA